MRAGGRVAVTATVAVVAAVIVRSGASGRRNRGATVAAVNRAPTVDVTRSANRAENVPAAGIVAAAAAMARRVRTQSQVPTAPCWKHVRHASRGSRASRGNRGSRVASVKRVRHGSVPCWPSRPRAWLQRPALSRVMRMATAASRVKAVRAVVVDAVGVAASDATRAMPACSTA